MHLCTAVSSSSGKSGQRKGNRTKAARKDEKATEKAEVEKIERAEVAYTEWKRAKVCSSLGVAVEQLTMSVFPFTTSHVERCSASLRLTHRTVGCLAPHCASLTAKGVQARDRRARAPRKDAVRPLTSQRVTQIADHLLSERSAGACSPTCSLCSLTWSRTRLLRRHWLPTITLTSHCLTYNHDTEFLILSGYVTYLSHLC